jgi:hypothetical protein
MAGGVWRRRPDSNRRIRVLQTPPLDHLGTSPELLGCPSRIRTSVHGSKVRCPTTRRRGNDPSSPQRREWSGRRDSNPRPSHWQCDALPTEPLPHRSTFSGAESQIRTGDTALFRRVLYQLSYLGPLAACHGDLKHQLVEDTLHGERAQRRGTRFVLEVGGWARSGSGGR